MFLLLTSTLRAAPLVVIDHTVEIEASTQATWDVLTDWDAYEEWNPWVTRASASDRRVDVTVVLGDRTMEARHRVILVQEPERFCWQDKGAFTLVAKGQRCRTLETADGGSTLRTELTLTGPLKGMADRRYGPAMRQGVRDESAALKRRAEDG